MQTPSYSIVEIPPLTGKKRARAHLKLEGRLPSIYAIGDVHGCFRELMEAEERIREDARRTDGDALIVYLGDYVDRGPDSASVLRYLAGRHDDGLARVALCGNHDDTFLKFLRDPSGWLHWLGPNFGGLPTLASFGIDVEEALLQDDASLTRAVPVNQIAFLAGLPIFLQAGRHLFVHAGVKPGIPLEQQDNEDMLWIREPFLTNGPELPLVVVHGHTPCGEPEFAAGRIGIDTGCFATGRLTVLKVDAAGARLL